MRGPSMMREARPDYVDAKRLSFIYLFIVLSSAMRRARPPGSTPADSRCRRVRARVAVVEAAGHVSARFSPRRLSGCRGVLAWRRRAGAGMGACMRGRMVWCDVSACVLVRVHACACARASL